MLGLGVLPAGGGDRAVGVQDLDEQARTVRFILDFTPQAIRPHGQWVGTRINMFVQMYNTQLVKNAPKTAKPAPLVEKIDTLKPVDDSTAKVTPKKEIQAAKTDAQKPPPPPEPEKAKPAAAKDPSSDS